MMTLRSPKSKGGKLATTCREANAATGQYPRRVLQRAPHSFRVGCLFAIFLLAMPAAEAARGKLTPPAKKGTAAGAKTRAGTPVATNKRPAARRVARGRRTPVLLGTPRALPIEQPLSPEVLEHLQRGDIVHAARGLLMEPASEKTLYLLREAQRIGEAQQTAAPKQEEAHRHYLNLGVANHNLYLFLRRHNMAHPHYVRSALAAYAKARKAATKTERSEVDLLTLALWAASGKEKIAAKRFRKLAPADFQQSFQGATYLATYYAAQRDVPHTVEALRLAHGFNPAATRGWLRVSDDFVAIKDDETLRQLFTEWEVLGSPRKEPPAAPLPKKRPRK